HLTVKLAFAEETNGYEFTLVPNAEDRFFFSNETVWYHEKSFAHPYKEMLMSGQAEAKLPDYAEGPSSRVAQYVIGDLKSWKLYHFHDTSDSAKVKQTGDVSDSRVLQPDAG